MPVSQSSPLAGVATHEGICPAPTAQSLVVSSVSHQSCRFRILGWVGARGLELVEVKCLVRWFGLACLGEGGGLDETEDWYLGYVMFVETGFVVPSFPWGLVLVLVFRGYMCVWFGLDRSDDLSV